MAFIDAKANHLIQAQPKVRVKRQRMAMCGQPRTCPPFARCSNTATAMSLSEAGSPSTALATIRSLGASRIDKASWLLGEGSGSIDMQYLALDIVSDASDP